MQPDNDNNYWKKPESEEISEVYTPPQDDDTDVVIDSNDVNDEVEIADNQSVNEEPVHWSSSEYIHEEKNIVWFIIFAIVVVVLIAIDIFLLQSYTFSALVVVMAIAVVIYSRRPPHLVDYTLSINQGLYVGEKLYHFNNFKAFGLINDRGNHSIMLIPIKRFAPGVSVYFPEEAGEKIVDILGARLPMETLKLDFVDVIIRKLKL